MHRQKLNIIHHRCKCSHQVLHEAHTPSRCHSDQSPVSLPAMWQCCRVSVWTSSLPSSVHHEVCRCYNDSIYKCYHDITKTFYGHNFCNQIIVYLSLQTSDWEDNETLTTCCHDKKLSYRKQVMITVNMLHENTFNTTTALAVSYSAPPKIQECHSCIFGGAKFATANALVVFQCIVISMPMCYRNQHISCCSFLKNLTKICLNVYLSDKSL